MESRLKLPHFTGLKFSVLRSYIYLYDLRIVNYLSFNHITATYGSVGMIYTFVKAYILCPVIVGLTYTRIRLVHKRSLDFMHTSNLYP